MSECELCYQDCRGHVVVGVKASGIDSDALGLQCRAGAIMDMIEGRDASAIEVLEAGHMEAETSMRTRAGATARLELVSECACELRQLRCVLLGGDEPL